MSLHDLKELITISRMTGERLDLVQAGGGNSSAKFEDGTLYVKASGMMLGDVRSEREFCQLNWKPLCAFLDTCGEDDVDARALEEEANFQVSQACVSKGIRPSIETLMHCALGPLTLHTHPIAVTALCCRKDWKDILSALFPEALLIDYLTPGAALALAIHREVKKRNRIPNQPLVIFLQNHGMILAASSAAELAALSSGVANAIALNLGLDLSRYALPHSVSQTVNETCSSDLIGYLSEDAVLLKVAAERPEALLAPCATPDQLVYCGPRGIALEHASGNQTEIAIDEFYSNYKQPPKVVLLKESGKMRIVLLANSLKKCREAEDVLKSHAYMLSSNNASDINYLAETEVSFLSRWDAEKYRQKV